MAEFVMYNGDPDEKDKARTAELKKFASEVSASPSEERDREQQTMNRASAEVKRRAEKTMLYANLDYHTAATRVLQSDKELAMLYSHGRMLE